jgi:L-rhamnose mutarotase
MAINKTKAEEWETLMWNYQQASPTTKEDKKWLLLENLFKL